MRQNVVLLGQAIGQLKAMGLAVGPQQTYDFFKMACESLGFTSPERFAIDPNPQNPAYIAYQKAQQQAAQSMPQPQVEVAKIKAQATLGQEQAENAREALKMKADQQIAHNQMVHEALQQHNDRGHQAVQGHKDREVQLDGNHLQIILKLIPALAQILAAEKASAAELGPDVATAGSQIQ
jgi:hypothetical protein